MRLKKGIDEGRGERGRTKKNNSLLCTRRKGFEVKNNLQGTGLHTQFPLTKRSFFKASKPSRKPSGSLQLHSRENPPLSFSLSSPLRRNQTRHSNYEFISHRFHGWRAEAGEKWKFKIPMKGVFHFSFLFKR